MKQLSLFDAPVQKISDTPAPKLKLTYWKLCVDGAARNNPGPAGAGICIIKNDRTFQTHGFYLGSKTNNKAEYLALVVGLFYLNKLVTTKDDVVLIVSDSQLLIRQLEGKYKVKDAELKKLHELAHTILINLNYDVEHVMREDNTQADKLANKGIDKKILLTQDVLTWLRSYDITI